MTETSDWRITYLMRQSLFFRLLGSLLVPLYAMGAWIAPALQVCPMHGSPAGAHAAAQMAGQHSAHNQHSAHAEVATASDHAPSQGMVMAGDAPANMHAHGCDCVGCCASPNGPAVPGTQLAFAAPVAQQTFVIEMQNSDAPLTRVAHVLPFATAPPNTLV